MPNDPVNDERIEALIRQQAHAAQRAGPRNEQLTPLSDEALNAPLDFTELPAAATDPHLKFEGYKILRALSTGGQSCVYEAVQEATGRKVAVKVITGGPYITSQSRARFEREVKILASLDHPGIVRIIDRGRTADGSFFLVMAYIDGQNLDEYLRSNRDRLSQRDVIGLFIAILRALEAAHHKGIVHRDLKPSNLRIDRYDQPHILDFGLAGLAEEETFSRTITRTGNVIGSLPWASPEQASGDIRSIAAPSDLYSLAVVLYESLTGQFPYPVSGTLQEATTNICAQIPASPDRLPDAPFGKIKPILAAIILRALEKDPRNRFASAEAFREELVGYLDGSASIRPRRPRTNLYAVLIFFIGIISLLFVLHPWRTTEPFVPLNLGHSFNSLGMEFVRVPPGEFWMGSLLNERGHNSDEVHRLVKLTSGFRIAVSETTRGQYKQVMGNLPAGVPDDSPDWPVDNVSREDAEAFCRKLSTVENRHYQLPTEAQWEYACRAGTMTRFAGHDSLDETAWYVQNSGRKLHTVKSLQPNRWGLYDMLGNVAEWCADSYVPNPGPDPKVDPFEPAAWAAGVFRGGSAFSSESQSRCAARVQQPPQWHERGLGFRVVIVDDSSQSQKKF